MNTQQFLAGQIDASSRRARELDAMRDAMTEGGTPPECIAYVMNRFQAIADRQSAVAIISANQPGAEVARLAEQFFLPMIAELKNELVRALVVVWYAGPNSVAAMDTD
jgi:hypothetical protein